MKELRQCLTHGVHRTKPDRKELQMNITLKINSILKLYYCLFMFVLSKLKRNLVQNSIHQYFRSKSLREEVTALLQFLRKVWESFLLL